jgi:hypothetical protein
MKTNKKDLNHYKVAVLFSTGYTEEMEITSTSKEACLYLINCWYDGVIDVVFE